MVKNVCGGAISSTVELEKTWILQLVLIPDPEIPPQRKAVWKTTGHSVRLYRPCRQKCEWQQEARLFLKA